jgi:hypothetical protein
MNFLLRSKKDSFVVDCQCHHNSFDIAEQRCASLPSLYFCAFTNDTFMMSMEKYDDRERKFMTFGGSEQEG